MTGQFDKLRDYKPTQTSDFIESDEMSNTRDRYYYDGLQIGLESDSVAVVIDGNSLHQCCRAIEKERKLMLPDTDKYAIDYDRFAKFLEANLYVKRKWYITSERLYTTNDEGGNARPHSRIRGLLDWMKFHQYVVKSIPFEMDEDHYSEEDSDYKPEHRRRKNQDGLMDVEITCALWRAAAISDHIVFVGSHKKFAAPLQIFFQEMGKRITVISTNMTSSKVVHDSLRQIDNFVDLADPDIMSKIISTTNHRRNFIPAIGVVGNTGS